MKKLLVIILLVVSAPVFSQKESDTSDDTTYFNLLSVVDKNTELIQEQVKIIGRLLEIRDSLISVLAVTSNMTGHVSDRVASPGKLIEITSYVLATDSLLLISMNECVLNINNHVKHLNSSIINMGTAYWGEDMSKLLTTLNESLVEKKDELLTVLIMIRSEEIILRQKMKQ